MERSQNTLGRWKNWSTCKWFHIEAVMICFQNNLCQYSYRSLSQEILLKIPRMFWVSLKNIKWISMIHGLYLEKRQIGFCYLKNDEHFYRIGVLEVSVHPMQLNALIIHSWTWTIVLVWHLMDRKLSPLKLWYWCCKSNWQWTWMCASSNLNDVLSKVKIFRINHWLKCYPRKQFDHLFLSFQSEVQLWAMETPNLLHDICLVKNLKTDISCTHSFLSFIQLPPPSFPLLSTFISYQCRDVSFNNLRGEIPSTFIQLARIDFL
jgi:hypothetical protein